MELPKFKKRSKCDAFCEKHNPTHSAIWVTDAMNTYASAGYYREYVWVQKWALEHHIYYDNAYCGVI